MEYNLTKSQNNTTLSVHPGDTIIIELDETPTTGYMWDTSSANSSVAQLQSSNYEMASSAMGGSGKRKIIFSVTGVGNSSISLQNKRQWSGDVADTFAVQLQST